MGQHGGTEKLGLIYTGKAGFLDLGHLRESCDLTKHAFDVLTAATAFPVTVTTLQGIATVRRRPASVIRVARLIGYYDAVGHEIWTYGIFAPGGHNSAFSPEDLCSNYLGTLLAERAIATGGAFDVAVTAELDALVAALDGQSETESLAAFGLVNGRWVDFSDSASLLSSTYLKRRSFGRRPWKAGHPSDTTTPAWVTDGLGNAGSFVSYQNTLVRTIRGRDFPAEFARIRLDAKNRYGTSYDRPDGP